MGKEIFLKTDLEDVKDISKEQDRSTEPSQKSYTKANE